MFKTFSRKMALAAVCAERYGLSLVYLYFAWNEFHVVGSLAGNEIHLIKIIRIEPLVTQSAVFAEAGRHTIALLLNLFTGIFLLLGRRAAVLPQTVKDVLVPLIAAFFNLTYNAVPWFPASVQKGFWPDDLQASFIAVGLLICVLGLAVAFWGILYLGRSFGIFVEVRRITLSGPYRRMRHPMYAGYIGMLAGLALANFSVAYFILVPIHIGLLLYRARLEETRLAEHSAKYREYTKRTGFIFPKLRRPALD
jgi:protein-S-isoprenylcysteine O-methyltransferase Ste14